MTVLGFVLSLYFMVATGVAVAGSVWQANKSGRAARRVSAEQPDAASIAFEAFVDSVMDSLARDAMQNARRDVQTF